MWDQVGVREVEHGRHPWPARRPWPPPWRSWPWGSWAGACPCSPHPPGWCRSARAWPSVAAQPRSRV